MCFSLSWQLVWTPMWSKELSTCTDWWRQICRQPKSWQQLKIKTLIYFSKTKMMKLVTVFSLNSTRYLLCTKSQVRGFWKKQSWSTFRLLKRSTFLKEWRRLKQMKKKGMRLFKMKLQSMTYSVSTTLRVKNLMPYLLLTRLSIKVMLVDIHLIFLEDL